MVVQSAKGLEQEVELIQQAREDARAFRPLYEHYYKSIFLFVLHRVGDKQLTADVTAQVFLKALQNIKKYEDRGLPFSAWLYRIAVNEVNDFFRKQKRERLVTIEENHVVKLHEEMMDGSTVENLHLRLHDVLQELLPEELHLIELRFFEERSFKEIGAILNLTEVHAKVKTYRTLDKMKKYFIGTK
jgi:RNA polymerase sigma-70 factor, ECF subfamily